MATVCGMTVTKPVPPGEDHQWLAAYFGLELQPTKARAKGR